MAVSWRDSGKNTPYDGRRKTKLEPYRRGDNVSKICNGRMLEPLEDNDLDEDDGIVNVDYRIKERN